MTTLELINNYILENKELIRKYICKRSNESTSTCCFYITKGKYKNTVCGRKIVSNGYCKVHSKYSVESYNIPTDKCVGIELTEFLYNGEKLLKTIDNIVYSNFDTGYFPIGELDEESGIIDYYK